MQNTLPEETAGDAQVYHQCPACQRLHAVHPVLHRVACGRQLTCSPHCKLQWQQQVRQAIYQRHGMSTLSKTILSKTTLSKKLSDTGNTG